MAWENETPSLKNPQKDKKKRFLNGWTREQEELMSQWADIAMCYRWLHGRSESYYKNLNNLITIPVIILSTLTGTASVGLSSIVGDNQSAQKYAQLSIGGVSIIIGILSTLGNYLRFAQLQEGNRVASQLWGKFHRNISAELALHPDRRMDSTEFIKLCRTELDRLIESAPELYYYAVKEFNNKYGKINTITLPDEAERIEHTKIFLDDNLRLKQLALDAALVIRSKKDLVKDMEFSDKEIRIFDTIENRLKKHHENEFGDYVVDSDSITNEYGKENNIYTTSRKELKLVENEEDSASYSPHPSSPNAENNIPVQTKEQIDIEENRIYDKV